MHSLCTTLTGEPGSAAASECIVSHESGSLIERELLLTVSSQSAPCHTPIKSVVLLCCRKQRAAGVRRR